MDDSQKVPKGSECPFCSENRQGYLSVDAEAPGRLINIYCKSCHRSYVLELA